MAQHKIIGEIGENIASAFLEKQGHTVLERNFRRPYGEIDIISRGTDGIHFVEVKSVSWGTAENPEENVHPQKIRRLKRIIDTYLVSHGIDEEWHIDVLCVYVNRETRKARIKWLKDIVFE